MGERCTPLSTFPLRLNLLSDSQKDLEVLSFRQRGEGLEVLLYVSLSCFYIFEFLVEEGDIMLL